MTTLSVKPLTSILKPRREVIDGRITEAVNLANIFIYNELRDRIPGVDKLEYNPLYNSEEFMKRTYFSEEIKRIILTVMGGLARVSSLYIDERGNRFPVSKRVIVIPSALGGGKTHLLTLLYHIVKLYNERGENIVTLFEDPRLIHGLKHAIRALKNYGRVNVVVISGDTHTLAPTPDNPLVINGLRIHTPWGLMGYLLGEYDKVSSADQHYYSPDVDLLKEILRDKTVLILVDEAVEYMVKAVRLSEKYRDFDEAFLSFIRNLALAVDETPGTVLVITLPAEYREGVLTERYQHPEYVERIDQMLRRVGPEYHPPLVFEKDVCEVFKKRIFENIDSDEVRENLSNLIDLIKTNASRDSVLRESIESKYRDLVEYIEKLKKTYPFHPYFIELLVNIAVKNPGLGLTRYLLTYVARLVKYVYDKKDRLKRDIPLSIITPWIIPIGRVEFGQELLRGMISEIQSSFMRIYEQDVKKYSERLEEILFSDYKTSRDLKLVFLKACLARTIWLSTIPGRGGKSSEAIKQYIRKLELPIVIYDPVAMENFVIADVLNTLDELIDTSTYLVVTPDNRVFYALIPDILTIIREKYRSTTDLEAIQKLERIISPTSFRRGLYIKAIVPITSIRVDEVENTAKQELSKSTDPVLFIYLGLDKPPDDIFDIILKRNNIVLLLPELTKSPEELGLALSEKFERIIGYRPRSASEYLKTVLKLLSVVENLAREKDYLREFAGEEYLDYVTKILDDMKRELEKQFVTTVYMILRKAVLGLQKQEYEVDLKPFEEERVKDLSHLCKLLEDSLEKRGVLTKWDWSTIHYRLREWSDIWDIDYSVKKPVRVYDMWMQLLYSPAVKPHLTSFKEFEEALRNAYESNLIAFKHGDRIFWLKHPYSREEALNLVKTRTVIGLTLHDWVKDVENEIQKNGLKLTDLEIISPRYIIREYVQKLREKTIVKPEERVVRKLLVYTPDGEKEFETLIAQARNNDDLVEILSKYPVVLIEEKPERFFELVVLNVNNKPFSREPVVFEDVNEIVVNSIAKSSEEMKIKVTLEVRNTSGEVVDRVEREVFVNNNFNLSTRIRDPGEYLVILTAREPSGFKVELPVARVKIHGVECRDRVVKLSELLEIIESRRDVSFEIRSTVLKGLVKKYAVNDLRNLFEELGRSKLRVTGFIERKAIDEEIKVEFRNTSSDIVSRVIAALGVEDININVKIIGLTIDLLRKPRTTALLKATQPVVSLIDLEVKECRSV